MIPARFKVHNYCSIVWTPPLPGGKIASGATVVRVRGEQIVDSASFVFTKDAEAGLMDMRNFLDIDMLLIYDSRSQLKEINDFCFRQGLPLFANTFLDLKELLEEVRESECGNGNKEDILRDEKKCSDLTFLLHFLDCFLSQVLDKFLCWIYNSCNFKLQKTRSASRVFSMDRG